MKLGLIDLDVRDPQNEFGIMELRGYEIHVGKRPILLKKWKKGVLPHVFSQLKTFFTEDKSKSNFFQVIKCHKVSENHFNYYTPY